MTNDELKALTTINSDDLTNECQSFPERLVYMYDLHAEADRAYNMHNEALSAAQAMKYIQYRESMIGDGVKPTENLLANYVQADPAILEMVGKKYDLKEKRDFLHGLVQAMHAKREMLKTLSFLARHDEKF